MEAFFFKQFKVFQAKTAMKVGTDGVLLGAWANTSTAKTILDIGAGTGVISLMMAQKNKLAEIIAIEIEENAFLEAKKNFNISKWNNRVKAINISLQKFSTIAKFDLIVSNPPYFNNSFKANNTSRNIARQNDSLSFNDLLKSTASLLSKNGKACFILPFSEKGIFLKIAKKNKLFANNILYIKGNLRTEIKRILVEISFNETKIEEKTLSIEISRHNYTQDYIDLVQDFYFKM